MTEEKFDELVDNITSFMYDWDPYEFKDNYQLSSIYENHSLQQILEQEHLPEDRIPIAMDRIISILYHSRLL